MSRAERTSVFVYNAGVVGKLVGTGSLKGQEWMLSAGTFTIGRDPTCDLCLASEPGVSKVHCKITLENNQYVLADNESRNGTLVNKNVIKSTVLQDGDEIRICNAILKFEQEMAMPERPDRPKAAPARPAPHAAVPDEQTERVPSRPRNAPVKPAKAPRTWPYFMLGMLMFFGLAGGTLHMLGLLPSVESLRGHVPVILPVEPAPGDQP
ncbi:MAG: FHA domain-containing protein, partial [Myxococcota bacterium]